jgi:hypothetical protein
VLYMAFSGRPRGPARIRVAPPVHGAAAGGRAPGSRPAPLLSAPGPGGPGPSSSIGCSASGRCRTEAALRYGSRPIRAWSALSRDPRCAARARPPEGPLPRRRRTGVSVSAGEARGDANCVPARVVLVGPSDRVGAWGGTCAPRRSCLPVRRAQHPLAMCIRPQAKQVSPIESPVPGVPCHELRKRDRIETARMHCSARRAGYPSVSSRAAR